MTHLKECLSALYVEMWILIFLWFLTQNEYLGGPHSPCSFVKNREVKQTILMNMFVALVDLFLENYFPNWLFNVPRSLGHFCLTFLTLQTVNWKTSNLFNKSISILRPRSTVREQYVEWNFMNCKKTNKKSTYQSNIYGFVDNVGDC